MLMSLSSHNADSRRQLGESLATFVCSSSFSASGSNSLVGVIADLVADDPDMGPPLRDLVTRPIFLNLLPSAAKGGEGVLAQRDSLLTELNRTYNPDIVTAIGEVLNGFLGLHNSTEDSSHFSHLPSHFPIDSGNKYDEANSDIEHLRYLIASREWHKADQQTWTVLQNSINSNRGYISDDEWSLIPCDLIKEIDIIWSEGSTFRYGFSIQKAIWDEIVSQMRVRESHESVELSTTPSKIFYSLLRSSEVKHDHFRPGFFPGYGVWAQWDSSRYEWNITESSSGLISSFNLLCEKLRSCGPSINEIPLDSRTVSAIENLVDSAPYRSLKTTEKSFVAQSHSPVLDPDTGKSGCAGIFLLFLAIATIAGIASITQESSVFVSQKRPVASVEAISDKLDSLQKKLDDAVLICEIKPLISQIRATKTTGVAEGISAVTKRKDLMIANANKRIAYLDAAGIDEYWENSKCTYGWQWFDENANGSARIFLAVSKKCTSPKLNYRFTSDKKGEKLVRSGSLDVSGHISGERQIPFLDQYAYLWIDDLKCS